jgi:hypothetical protein
LVEWEEHPVNRRLKTISALILEIALRNLPLEVEGEAEGTLDVVVDASRTELGVDVIAELVVDSVILFVDLDSCGTDVEKGRVDFSVAVGVLELASCLCSKRRVADTE